MFFKSCIYLLINVNLKLICIYLLYLLANQLVKTTSVSHSDVSPLYKDLDEEPNLHL